MKSYLLLQNHTSLVEFSKSIAEDRLSSWLDSPFLRRTPHVLTFAICQVSPFLVWLQSQFEDGYISAAACLRTQPKLSFAYAEFCHRRRRQMKEVLH